MPDKFDPYRESLVIETLTIWPDELNHVSEDQRLRIERQLHAQPQQCAQLDYVRLHTGFCRQITVTPADLSRVGQQ
jgi:hypothetical protein